MMPALHTVHRYGDRALLVTELAEPARYAAAVQHAGLPLVDVAIGADSVMVLLDDVHDTAQVWAALTRLTPEADSAAVGSDVEIPVQYDGADLEAVADETGLSVDDVIEVHSQATFTVAFCGFAPGFAYLTGLPKVLHVPRLSTPRASVPAGSVAIAAEYSGVYPRSSPGGWRILGSTSIELFDVTRTPPALLAPGDRVRFVVP